MEKGFWRKILALVHREISQLFLTRTLRFGKKGNDRTFLLPLRQSTINTSQNKILKIFSVWWSMIKWSFNKFGRDRRKNIWLSVMTHGPRSVRASWPRAKYFPVRASHSVNKYNYFGKTKSQESLQVLSSWIQQINTAFVDPSVSKLICSVDGLKKEGGEIVRSSKASHVSFPWGVPCWLFSTVKRKRKITSAK